MRTKVLQRLKKKAVVACFFLVLLFQFSSCVLLRPIFQLVQFALQLPFRIIGLVFQLLPYALRYAPLALLLVRGENYDMYYALLTEKAEVFQLEGELYCFVIRPQEEKNVKMLAEMAVFNKDRMLFLSDKDFQLSSEKINNIYNLLKYNDLYLAFDSRLDLPAGSLTLDQNA